MNEKLPFYASLITLVLVSKVIGLVLLVSVITGIDILLGLYLIVKLKEEKFCFSRFLEGFLKMLFYAVLIVLAYLVSHFIFDGKLFGIEYLTPKIVTMLFVILEATSIDKKRVKLGKKPILETIRDITKVVKEFKNIKNEF
jgi:hypothetical protein